MTSGGNAEFDEARIVKEFRCEKIGVGVEPSSPQTGWSVTNNSVDRTIDANGAVAEIGDGLTTLINDLIAKGIISA